MGCTVKILPGRNVWVLARTDRDAVNVEEVVETSLAVLSRFLGNASPLNTRSPLEVFESPKTWNKPEARAFIGAARPLEVVATRAAGPTSRPTLPPGGVLLGRFEDCGEFMTIAVDNLPWLVVASFDWRAGEVEIEWPRRKVNALGFPDSDEQFGNDWLLLEARHYGEAKEEDSELSDELAEHAGDVADEVFSVGGKLVGLGLLGLGAYWLLTRSNKG